VDESGDGGVRTTSNANPRDSPVVRSRMIVTLLTYEPVACAGPAVALLPVTSVRAACEALSTVERSSSSVSVCGSPFRTTVSVGSALVALL
jgi:hypothetical protein